MTTTTRASAVPEVQLRRWLTLLGRPDRLADAEELAGLLESRGRLPDNGSAVDVGRAGAELLRDAIESLAPPDGAARDERLPYEVLKTCFLDGAKLWQAANKLGMSERQMTRERSRAIRLLQAELEAPTTVEAATPYRGEPIPAILGFVARAAPSRKLRKALADKQLVRVHGPPGVGKTSLVAELAAETAERTPTLWYRFRPGVNDSAGALLFELGEYLRARRRPELAAYIAEALPAFDPALATRLALKGLGGSPHFLVLDDYHLVDDDQAIGGLVEEAVARLPDLRVALISRHREGMQQAGACLAIPPFTRSETQTFLAQLGIATAPKMAVSVHQWTGGIPQLVKLAASWLKTATPEEIADEMESLGDLETVQAFFLDSITELLGPNERAILQAASVFRHSFTDDALAFVAERTRGEVQDTSRSLVRAYVATRGRDGDVAFFHHSVRDYVYARLPSNSREALHTRAALWYQRQGDDAEGAWHRARTAEDSR